MVSKDKKDYPAIEREYPIGTRVEHKCCRSGGKVTATVVDYRLNDSDTVLLYLDHPVPRGPGGIPLKAKYGASLEGNLDRFHWGLETYLKKIDSPRFQPGDRVVVKRPFHKDPVIPGSNVSGRQFNEAMHLVVGKTYTVESNHLSGGKATVSLEDSCWAWWDFWLEPVQKVENVSERRIVIDFSIGEAVVLYHHTNQNIHTPWKEYTHSVNGEHLSGEDITRKMQTSKSSVWQVIDTAFEEAGIDPDDILMLYENLKTPPDNSELRECYENTIKQWTYVLAHAHGTKDIGTLKRLALEDMGYSQYETRPVFDCFLCARYHSNGCLGCPIAHDNGEPGEGCAEDSIFHRLIHGPRPEWSKHIIALLCNVQKALNELE